MAFPFLFERTITTKVGETSASPYDQYISRATPPLIPREQLPHVAIKEAITAAADKAKSLASAASNADELAKVVDALKNLESLSLGREGFIVYHG